MKMPNRRTRALIAVGLAVLLLLFVWWDEIKLRLPSRQQAQVEALQAAFKRDYDDMSQEERGRRYKELVDAEQNLPESRRQAYLWEQAQVRHRNHVASLRRFAAMTPEEKLKALDHAIDETRETLKRTEEALRRPKSTDTKPQATQPVEVGKPIVWAADELQLRDNYSRALQERKAQRARGGW